MRKLTVEEHNALVWLSRNEPFTPGVPSTPEETADIFYMDSLCRKRRALAASTDDGPQYRLTLAGREEAGR